METTSKNLRVLLIEDNPGDARLIKEMLKEAGYEFEIKCVECLSSGIEEIKADGFDVVLLDLDLPDSQGLDTLIKLTEIRPESPVIVLTGLANEAIGVQAVKKGAQDYLIKGQIDKNLLARSITYAIERKRAEDLLRQSEEKYRNLVERAHDGIIIVQDGIIKFANLRMAELDGSSVDQLVGTSFTDHVHPSELSRLVDIYRRRMAGGMLSSTYETILLRKDGSSAPAELNAGIITYGEKPADMVIIRDITERKKMDEALKGQKKFAEDLMQNSAVAAFVLNPEHSIMLWNKACEELTGFSASDMIGTDNQWKPFYGEKRQTIADIIIDGNFEGASTFYAKFGRSALTPDGFHAEGWYRNLNGKDRYIIFDAAPIYDDKGALAYVIETLQDITDRKKAEEELRRSEVSYKELNVILGESLEEVKKREQTLLKGRDAFLNMLEDVSDSYKELVLAYDTTIEGWSRALDYRDKETEGHSQRVTEITLQIARATGTDEEELVHLRRGALLHDIGKMGIPDNILLKPGKLTDEEWAVMKRHPEIAHELLSPIAFLRPALDIPLCHHENWNGAGYPKGLKGEEIPLAARIFAVVDVWDALLSERPYRPPWPKEKVIDYIHSLAGVQFDPEVVKVFFETLEKSE